MVNTDAKKARKIRKKKEVLLLLAPMPALLVGALVMHKSGIPAAIYVQNLICYIVLGLILLSTHFFTNFFTQRKPFRSLHSPHANPALLGLGCILLALTFADPGLEGVHRWVGVGGFRLNMAFVVLPCMILGLDTQLCSKHSLYALAIVIVVAALLLLQPDASQLSAFAMAVMFLLLARVQSKPVKYIALPLFVCAVILAWVRLDTLEPVAHVEGILGLARDIGFAWFAAGLASLTVLLLPFVGLRNASRSAQALGIYYLTTVLATLFGHFPVPFVGHGVSSVIGYLLAVYALLRKDVLAQQTHR